ncbi:MAG: CBS domain-containing protein [Candidatus Omnitrophica bacterium]|nr:CBS domain-containing protein [Candidatus Omnitrophota bacterium]
MSKVYDIIKKKDGMIFSVKPQDTIRHTLKLMAEMNVGAVLILEGGRIIGIFSERDFARHSAKGQVRIEDALVKDMMTTSIVSVSSSQTTEECMSLMTSKRIRHLPVIDNEKLIGLISIGDVVKQVIEDQKFSITQLERYVSGDSYN